LVGVIASPLPPVVTEPSAEKELVRKPLLPRPLPKPKIKAPLSKRDDVDVFVKFFDQSEALIRFCKSKNATADAKAIYGATINLGHEHFLRAVTRNARDIESGKTPIASRGWYVLLDCYCIGAELYYEHDKSLVSDATFDAIGRELCKRYDDEVKRGLNTLRYPEGAFEPASAHAVYRDGFHKALAARIAYVLSTGPTLAPPKPRLTIQRGIKSRWA